MKGNTQLRAQAQGTSSAANSDGSAPRGSVFGRIFAATRGASRADGSGAPSIGFAPQALFALACLVFLALLGSGAPSAGAAVDPCPNAAMRTGMQRYLPDCRAYERVSPADKNGFDVRGDGFESPFVAGQASTDGDAVSFLTFGPMEGTPWGGTYGTHHYIARRGANGWSTEPLFPRPRGTGPLTEVPAFSSDLRLSLLKSSTPLTPSGADKDDGLYIRDAQGGLQPVLVGPDAPLKPIVASPDMSSVVFGSRGVLTAEPGQPVGSVQKLYEFRDGVLRLVSRAPGSNEPFVFWGSRVGGGQSVSTQNALSDDGRHIFFSNDDTGTREIYRRSDGATTTHVSPSRRTLPSGEQYGRYFQGASADGNVVFFTNESQMTDDANARGYDLYRYDVGADRLINLSAGTPGDAPAFVQHVVALGKDGRSAYFVANGQVVPGEGVDGLPNLYLWEDDGTASGNVRFIGTLDPADVPGTGWTRERSAQFTADGRFLAFVSIADVDGVNPTGTPQVYRYDSEATDPANALICLSCTGTASGDSGLARRPASSLVGNMPRAISEDGRRVIFSSQNALVPRDSNGRYDAYLWQDGIPHLLSTGASPEDSFAYGMSTNGDQIFFRTREALAPEDVDRLIDLYAAPIGGGFLPMPRETCTELDCRDAVGPPPAALTPGTATAGRSGNVSHSRAKLTVKRITRAQLRRAARTGVLRLAVRASRTASRRTPVLAARLS